MSYRIVHRDKRGVRLRRTNIDSLFSALGMAFAALMATIGGGMLLAGNGASIPTGAAFLCGALLFGLAPRWLIDQRRAMDPRELVFDNRNALLAVMHSDHARGFLPYQAIAGFAVRHETYQGSGDAIATSSTIYIAHLMLKNGGKWDLLGYRDEAAAHAACALLAEGVALDRRCKALPEAQLPARMKIEDRGDSMTMRWRNAFPLGLAAFLGLFFAAYFAILHFFGKVHRRSGDWLDEWIQPLMFGVGALLLPAMLYNLWRSVGGEHRLVIDRKSLTVERIDRHGNCVASHALPIAEILGVKFDLGETAGAGPLTIWSAAAQTVERRLAAGEVSWSLLKDAFDSARKALTIDLGLCSVAERLTIEQTIERALQRYRHDEHLLPPRRAHAERYWWERTPTLATRTRDALSEVLANRSLGVLSIVLAPLPLLLPFAALGLSEQRAWYGPLLQGVFFLQLLVCGLALSMTYRLLRAGAARIRAALLGLTTLYVLSQLVAGQRGDWLGGATLLTIILSIAAAIALLQLPEEDSE